MKTIYITSSLSTKLLTEFDDVQTIEIESKPFAEGAFGEVYVCLKVNNIPTSIPQVIKIFKEDIQNRQDHNYNTVRRLQQKINEKDKQLAQQGGKRVTDQYPALKGIPQFSFEGIINGKLCRGFSSTNLKKIGFVEFIDILDVDKHYKEYQKVSIDKKILIAFHLASGFRLLKEVLFIHADLKPEAIFINTKSNECAIIDYDGGTITENAKDTPNVWGAPNDWVAPEIWDQLKQIGLGGLQQVRVNLLSDLWSVAVGIHYILTTTHPLFYLNELSPRIAKEYFAKYKWPEIEDTELYFNTKNQAQYGLVINWYQKTLPDSIYKQLYNTVNHGYLNPTKRTSYDIWENVLSSVQEPPIITEFMSNRNQILLGNDLVLKWNIQNSTSVVINNNIGVVSANDEIQISPSRSVTYKLVAENAFGRIQHTIEIEVLPQVKILEFKARNHKISFGTATQLVWNATNVQKVEVRVDGKIESVTSQGEKDIYPTETTKYTLVTTALDGITISEQEIIVQVFKSIKIISFKADFDFVVQSIPVTLTWQVANANKIVLEDGSGNHTDITNITNFVDYIKKDSSYIIRCTNDLFESISDRILVHVVQNKYELELSNLVPRFDQLIPDIGKAVNMDYEFVHSLNYDDIIEMQIFECNLNINLSNGEIETKIAKKVSKLSSLRKITDKIKAHIKL